MSVADIATAFTTVDPDCNWEIDPAHWLAVATAARGSKQARISTGIEWPDDLRKRFSKGPIPRSRSADDTR